MPKDTKPVGFKKKVYFGDDDDGDIAAIKASNLVPLGYIKTASGRYKDIVNRTSYDIPPSFALLNNGQFVEGSEEEEA
jgi:hypothetical protein